MDPLDAAMKTCGADAFVHYATGEDADMRYLTRFVMHDSFVFFKRRRQRGTIIVPQMEAERASRESTTAVMTRTQAGLPDILKKEKDPWKAIALMISGQAGKTVLVSPAFPAVLLRALEEHTQVIVDDGTMEKVRAKKSPAEIRLMQDVQRKTERAMALGISLIRHATVRKGVLYHDGTPLTSERVRIAMHKQLMDDGCRAVETIISCGEDTAYPHIIGSGPLKPHEPIVIDTFPRDETTGYYADMTRTVSKGEPDARITEMYEAVREAQQVGVARIRAGVSGADPYTAVVDYFKDRGYESDTRGFIHNLGHGVGLQVHELPTIGPSGVALGAGSVVTVEPGLYYPGIGGVRLEDIGVVRARQFVDFTRFEETLIV
ncbi:Xaa-Pro peptidase family protein [Methanoregula sp.]|uniref:Xaa-Pro peptidase family protein n=1 Tax=Methanoregula sp. TaxID=2052170 RepID=UPI002D7E674C|nr:Xaa-Pro peptidase family protein [Methanoregula sp.]